MICVIATIGSLSAQVQVIDVWNGKVPGAIQSDEFKQHVDTTAGWVDKHSIVKPDLYFYPAPAEKATGTAVIICPEAAMQDWQSGMKDYRWLSGSTVLG